MSTLTLLIYAADVMNSLCVTLSLCVAAMLILYVGWLIVYAISHFDPHGECKVPTPWIRLPLIAIPMLLLAVALPSRSTSYAMLGVELTSRAAVSPQGAELLDAVKGRLLRELNKPDAR